MANRFPLIVNSSASQIQELAAGDNLDLSSSNISNVGNVTVASTLTAVSLSGTLTTGAQPNITSTGTLISLNVTGTGNIGNLVLNKYNELLPASANTSTSITPDLVNGSIFRYTANASFTFNSLANAVSGSSAVVVITQGGSGSYTLTSTMKFAGGSKTLSTAVGAIDIISVFYDGTTYYATLSKGYA